MSYRTALLLLLFVQGLYFNRVLLDGEVIYAHNNALKMGVVPWEEHRLSYPRLSDHSDYYIPELNEHLHGQAHSWISVWNPHVELGRPLGQISGLGKANLLTHLLALGTHDPLVLYTALAVITVCLSGVFFFAFLQVLGLNALSCLCAAAGLSLGVYNSFWLTFPMYISTICWTVALLWLSAVFIRCRSIPAAVGISFASYNLLMTGYAQFIVFQAYLLTAFALVQLARAAGPRTGRLVTGALLAGAAFSGAAMAAPVYLDLAIDAGRSTRFEMSSAHLLTDGGLPVIHHLQDLGKFLSQMFDTFWYGNPISSAYPFQERLAFLGLSFTPVFGGLLLLSLMATRWRDIWLWQVIGLLALIGTVWPPAHLFAIQHLGFHMSPFEMLRGATIPGFILCGYTIDQVLRHGIRWRILASGLLLAPLLLAALAATVKEAEPLHIRYVLLSVALVIGTAAFVWTRSGRLLQGLVVVTIFAYGYRLMLTRPAEEIHFTSPLVKTVRAETQDGSRLAKYGPTLCNLIPPNQEALLGIQSIHSYNPLACRNYGELAARIGGDGAHSSGRYFGWLESEPRLSNPAFSYCGIGLVLSIRRLDPKQFHPAGEINGVMVYKPVTPPILQAQLQAFQRRQGNQVVVEGPLDRQPAGEVRLVQSFDDWKQYRVRPADRPTLLFVSQQYHPSWAAMSPAGPLETVLINDFFLGVVVPPQVEEVTLEFRPWARWSWLPQLLYVAGGLGCLGLWLGARRKKRTNAPWPGAAQGSCVAYLPGNSLTTLTAALK